MRCRYVVHLNLGAVFKKKCWKFLSDFLCRPLSRLSRREKHKNTQKQGGNPMRSALPREVEKQEAYPCGVHTPACASQSIPPATTVCNGPCLSLLVYPTSRTEKKKRKCHFLELYLFQKRYCLGNWGLSRENDPDLWSDAHQSVQFGRPPLRSHAVCSRVQGSSAHRSR